MNRLNLILFILIGTLFPQTPFDSVNCLLEPDVGPCDGAFPRYYFDQNEAECRMFVWGGCEGVVPFETWEDCAQSCGEWFEAEHEGTYSWGFETNSFQPCGIFENWWVTGDVNQLVTCHDSLAPGQYNPVFVRVRGMASPPGYYGHLGVYQREFYLTELLSCAPIDENPCHMTGFEHGLDGWRKTAIDIDLGTDTIQWSIDANDSLPYSGYTSLEFYLENYNDAGKIWVQKAFPVSPATNYEISLSFKFASADWGQFNLWTIIAGVHGSAPQTAADLTYQGSTGTGADTSAGFVWMDKEYDFQYSSGSDTAVWVTTGIWGNWETPRTYYLDNLTVIINPSIISAGETRENPSGFSLMPNYPNPFNPATTIQYDMDYPGLVTLTIFDILGNVINTLVEGPQSAGLHTVIWDGSNENGRISAAGIYFYCLKSGNSAETRKMILLK